MLTISNIPEALAELDKKTGRAWTDSELFDLATRHGIELHAAPPITAQTTIQEFVIGEGLVEKFKMPPGHSQLAVLFPAQVGQLWVSGETLTRQAYSRTQKEGEYHWFTEPVRVTREQVRIKSQSLQKILGIWNRAQTGEEPRHRGPEWMFPTVTATTPAPVVALGDEPTPETVVQRRARYLAWHTEESRINERGALQRVFERESKQNPRADRANIGKDINKARVALNEKNRAGAWTSQLVQDGKHKG